MGIRGFRLAPPAPDLCQQCAKKHRPDYPHDNQSLYYQFWFYHANGKWPTWEDAMKHCDADLRKAFRAKLKDRGEKLA